jgi:hypothetical protein
MHARGGLLMGLTCDCCAKEFPPSAHGRPHSAMAEGWSSFEVLRDDGETVDLVVLCPDCLSEMEAAR